MEISLLDVLKYEIGGNSIQGYILAAIIFAAVFAGLKIFKYFIIEKLKKLAEKTSTEFDDLFENEG